MGIITQVVLPLILAFIMFSMGLSLVVDDFKKVAIFPKAFAIGLFLQVISLPLIAYVLAYFWSMTGDVPSAFLVGLIIIAACPGGVTSNLMTHLGNGDTALSISLTAIISILSVLTIPIIVNLGFSAFLGAENETALPVAKTIVGIFCITTVPVILGMILNHKKHQLAQKLEPIFRKIASVFFVIIVLAAIVKDWALLMSSLSTLAPIILFFNLIVMLVAFGLSKLAKLNSKQQVAITLECGLQNGTLAIMIASTFLNNQQMVLPGAIYSIFMFITGGIFLWILKLRRRRTGA